MDFDNARAGPVDCTQAVRANKVAHQERVGIVRSNASGSGHMKRQESERVTEVEPVTATGQSRDRCEALIDKETSAALPFVADVLFAPMEFQRKFVWRENDFFLDAL
jgi:hypothetical protein